MLVAFLAWIAAAHADSGSDGLRIDRLSRGFVAVYAVTEGGRTVVIDTQYAHSSRWLARGLAHVGIDPRAVSAIVLTHGHGDHAGGVTALKAATGAPVIVGAGDVPMVEAGHNEPIHATGLVGALVRPSIPQTFPAFTPDVVVEDRLDLSQYGVDGVAEVVGGHTNGSMVVRLDSGDVFVGDLVRGRFGAHHRPVEHFFQPDVPHAHDVLKHVVAEGGERFWPNHGDVMTKDTVERWVDRKRPTAERTADGYPRSIVPRSA